MPNTWRRRVRRQAVTVPITARQKGQTHIAAIPSGVHEHVITSSPNSGLQLGKVATQPSGYDTAGPASPACGGPPSHAPSFGGITVHAYVVVAG